MSNAIIKELVKQYSCEGMTDKEAHLEALETYKEIKAEIRAGADAREVLMDYGLEIDFVVDVL